MNGSGGGKSRGLIILGVVVLIALIAGGWLVSGYNGVVARDEQVKSRWAQVDNQ